MKATVLPYIHVYAITLYNDLVSYCDKREVLQQEYFQTTILPSPHFR